MNVFAVTGLAVLSLSVQAQARQGPGIYGTKSIVFASGIGHSGGEMFRSDAGKPIIFSRADRAAAALRGRGGL
jgi:hypothetical protein